MQLIDLKKPKCLTDRYLKCHFRLKREIGAERKHTLVYTCKSAWTALFQNLRRGEPWGDLIIWQISHPVVVRPASSAVDESNAKFQRPHHYYFEDRDYLKDLKQISKLTDPHQAEAARVALTDEFNECLSTAILKAFEAKEIQRRYEEYNPEGRPFSILVTEEDHGLHASDFTLLWKNRKGLNDKQLQKAVKSAKGKPLPTEERELSGLEQGRAKWKATKQRESKERQKLLAKKKRMENEERERKSKLNIPANAQRLEPNIRFRSGTIFARCKKAWLQLFEILYEYSVDAESIDIALWETDADGTTVRLTPRSSNVDESGSQPDKSFHICFSIDGLAEELKRTKGGRQPDIRREFTRWVNTAIVDAFQSEPVQVEYSWFNEDGKPFSILSTPDDQGLNRGRLELLLGENGGLDAKQVKDKQRHLGKGEAYKAPSKRSRSVVNYGSKASGTKSANRKLQRSKKPNTTAAGWRRFYFDDGKTRQFWYIERKGSKRTILSGALGSEGKLQNKSFASATAAKSDVDKLITLKQEQGYIEYAPEDISYRRKNRCELKRVVRPGLERFEKERGLKIPEEFRRYILAVNGGDPNPNSVTLPGHPELGTVEIGYILGFGAGQPVYEIPYMSALVRLPPGHVLVASGEFSFSVDQSGAIHFWDDDQLDESDRDDDNVFHYDRIESFIVAASFDEFLTRLAKFPNDTNFAAKPQRKKKPAKTATEQQAAVQQKAAESPLRRFFVDDGNSRKFWHIHTKGNSQTTRYGRLGATGSESTKSFDSADKAKASTEKLIGQKLKKGYSEVLPDLLTISKPRKWQAASAADIKKLEKEIGTTLPDEYRRFLKTINGGELNPGFVEIPGVPRIANVSVDVFYGLYPDQHNRYSLWWSIQSHSSVLPANHLPIASGADVFTLSLTKKRGCIFFWDHESSLIDDEERFMESAGHLLAHSFDEFLTRIALFSSAY